MSLRLPPSRIRTTIPLPIRDTASGSTSGGGGTGNANYQLSIGESTSTYGYGWGTSTWGASTWGTARSSSTVVIYARNWSLDNFGEDLIATVINGGTYKWDLSGGVSNRAAVVTNAPTASRFGLVSADTRHLVLFWNRDNNCGYSHAG